VFKLGISSYSLATPAEIIPSPTANPPTVNPESVAETGEVMSAGISLILIKTVDKARSPAEISTKIYKASQFNIASVKYILTQTIIYL
jgi:hypothetical protein